MEARADIGLILSASKELNLSLGLLERVLFFLSLAQSPISDFNEKKRANKTRVQETNGLPLTNR